MNDMATKTEFPLLTEAQDRVLRAFAKLAADNPSPSIAEWADAAELNYTTMHGHRRALERAGLLTNTPGRVRSTRLTELGAKYVTRKRKTK